MRFLLIVSILFVSVFQLLYADDWPLERHDPANTGVSSDHLPLPLTIAWKTTLSKSQNYSSDILQMVAGDGIIYISDGTALYALDAQTGLIIWRVGGRWVSLSIMQRGIAAVESIGYVDQYGRLAIFDKKTGKILMSRIDQKMTSDDGVIDSLTVYQGRLYGTLHSHDRLGLAEIDPQTGSVTRYVYITEEGWSMGTPAFRDGMAYWGAGHYLCRFRLANMTSHIYSSLYDGGNCYPILWQDKLCMQGWGNWASVLTLKSNSLKSSFGVESFKGDVHAIAPGGNGRLLEIDRYTNYLDAYDFTSGKCAWSFATWVAGRCIATPDMVVVQGRHRKHDRHGKIVKDSNHGEVLLGMVYLLNSRTGKVQWHWHSPSPYFSAQPIIIDQHLVLCNGNTIYNFAGASQHR